MLRARNDACEEAWLRGINAFNGPMHGSEAANKTRWPGRRPTPDSRFSSSPAGRIERRARPVSVTRTCPESCHVVVVFRLARTRDGQQLAGRRGLAKGLDRVYVMTSMLQIRGMIYIYIHQLWWT